ncbi:hypothetical protein D3C73_1413700 [compost metagenome]
MLYRLVVGFLGALLALSLSILFINSLALELPGLNSSSGFLSGILFATFIILWISSREVALINDFPNTKQG